MIGGHPKNKVIITSIKQRKLPVHKKGWEATKINATNSRTQGLDPPTQVYKTNKIQVIHVPTNTTENICRAKKHITHKESL